jgi:hypothetical protein
LSFPRAESTGGHFFINAMRTHSAIILTFAASLLTAAAQDLLTFTPPKPNGKKVVLVAGDDE